MKLISSIKATQELKTDNKRNKHIEQKEGPVKARLKDLATEATGENIIK